MTQTNAFKLLYQNFASLVALSHDDRHAANQAMRLLDDSLSGETVNREVARCTFKRRRYGRATFTWAHHPELGDLGDPWQGLAWPKSSLAVALACKAINP